MSPEVQARLLASIDAGRLVVVCGAGLSMAPPSQLPSARRVAEMCFDRYQLIADPACDPALRTDLEALAEHFAALNTLKSVFIQRLVPWDEFVRPRNVGHAAVADFLIIRGFAASLSTNYDTLIERPAWDYGFDFQAALDGDEATVHAATQAPLLKFHGCANRDRQATVWARSQLKDPTIAARIEKSKTWMAANLRERDLFVIGFWSDWNYLNTILGAALKDVTPSAVIVVDPSETAQLEQKAPDLWAVSHAANVTFIHVQESGADVLDTLRRAFSRNYIRQMLAAGREAIESELHAPINPAWAEVPDVDAETLYGWRRDAEGVPGGSPATAKHPINAETVGYFHLLMRRAGAQHHAEGYEIGGRTVRVVNGAGALLNVMRSKFLEAPVIPSADIVVAAGATDVGVPADIVRRGRVGHLIRPAARGEWLDVARARAELNV